jgi:hypothetical protein
VDRADLVEQRTEAGNLLTRVLVMGFADVCGPASRACSGIDVFRDLFQQLPHSVSLIREVSRSSKKVICARQLQQHDLIVALLRLSKPGLSASSDFRPGDAAPVQLRRGEVNCLFQHGFTVCRLKVRSHSRNHGPWLGKVLLEVMYRRGDERGVDLVGVLVGRIGASRPNPQRWDSSSSLRSFATVARDHWGVPKPRATTVRKTASLV